MSGINKTEYGKAGEEVKEISYAYPYSENAKDGGYADDGCYVLSVGVLHAPMKKVRASTDFAVVMTDAESIPCKWSPFTFLPSNVTQPVS